VDADKITRRNTYSQQQYTTSQQLTELSVKLHATTMHE